MELVRRDHADNTVPSRDSILDALLPGRKELDPKGDIVLELAGELGPCQLLVSSRVLEMSCPFFKKMLQSNGFSEGIEQPNVQHPPVKQLREDHVGIFLMICRVLHYLPVRPPDFIEDYRHLADLCNFYGCSWALSFHVRAWMEAWNFSGLPTEQLKTLLWAAFVFHLRDAFAHLSLDLAKALTLDEWKQWEVHPMPLQLKGSI